MGGQPGSAGARRIGATVGTGSFQTLAAVQRAHLDLEAVARQDGVDAGATQAGLPRQAVRT
ncbi:MAG: hypothetical protein ACRDGB_03770, partial [Candidatus Limnocylindria bacterium]